MHARAGGLLRALVPAVEETFKGRHRRILLVSHAATVIALARALVGDEGTPLRVGTCTLTDARRLQPGAGPGEGWEAVKRADGAHLKEGSLRDWGFEDCVVVDGKVGSLTHLPNCVRLTAVYQVVNHQGEPGSENEVDEPVGLQIDLLPPGLRA